MLSAKRDEKCSCVVLLQHSEQRSGNLAHFLLEQMRFLQAVTSPEDITPAWVAKRNELAMVVCNLVGDDHIEDDSNPTSVSQLV